ncbi:heme oxygenase (biliverdin-producing) [Yinghuangia seranimata]|uniref:biliverdin-producing heme oxygenase n=1 Tax=Yinghuangia seranimata TaxID=408067 RepID=UPI00248B68DF|nr:biliverdin-producing heme oxygenase [Yinghuangia seranimata]MDI2125273.1 biliverdin-producing heme oxygenase [Yinghuangia seranimata]
MTTTETTGQTAAEETFSATIRRRSWSGHQSAEGEGFLDVLMRGGLTREAYTAMVAQHYWAYEVLEQASAVMRGNDVAAPFCPETLDRMAALEADLAFLAGDGWRETYPASASTVRYIERIKEKCFDWPGGFVAHHYTRYLGDMSGGQHIAKVMRRHFGLTGHDGTEFYNFEAVGDLDAFKTAYRTALDTAPWDDEERESIIQEVLYAYEVNGAVLRELGDEMEQWRKAG